MRYPSEQKVKNLVEKANITFKENPPRSWHNGLLIGNGNLAAIGYIPGNYEWVINKTDVFDGRLRDSVPTPHDKLMKMIEERGDRTSYFVSDIERQTNRVDVRSLSAAVLRLFYGGGALGWNAPAYPLIDQNLSVYDGVLTSKADAHFLHSTVKSFIPRTKNVMAVRLSGTSLTDMSHKIELYVPLNDTLPTPAKWHEEGEGELVLVQDMPGEGTYALAIAIKPIMPTKDSITYKLPFDFDMSELSATVSKPVISTNNAYFMGTGDADIFVSVVTSYETKNFYDKALENVRKAKEEGADQLEKQTKDYWHKYWNTSLIDMGKYTDIQKYAIFSMYELCCSYGKAPQPALSGMLYGPLNETIAGVDAHNYTQDQNVQIPLMPAPIINHAEFFAVMADTYLSKRDRIVKHTKRLFGEKAEGFFLPLVSNQNAEEILSGCYRYTLCAGAYVGTMLCWCWDYTKDKRIMASKLYPLLVEIIKFYTTALMEKGEDGLYHLDLSIPPEVFYFTKDDTATLSMLKRCMETVLEYADQEYLYLPEFEKWRDILNNYPPVHLRRDGAFSAGPDIPEDYFSFATHHLYPFFPGETFIDEKGREAAKKTLEYVDKKAIERVYANDDGWCFIHDWSWHNYYTTKARLGESQEVWNQLFVFLDRFAKSNGLFVHNANIVLPSAVTEANHDKYKSKDEITGDLTTTLDWYKVGKCATPNKWTKDLTAPVIEGNSVFLLRTLETLLQSFDGIINLFPGVPEDFKGAFYGLRAKGGYTVSGKKDKKGIVAKIKAKEDGVLKIYDYGFTANVPYETETNFGKKCLVIKIKKGQTVVIKSK